MVTRRRQRRHLNSRRNKGGKYDKNTRRYSPITNPTITLEEHQEQERIRQQEAEEQRLRQLVRDIMQTRNNPERLRQLIQQLPNDVLESLFQQANHVIQQRHQ